MATTDKDTHGVAACLAAAAVRGMITAGVDRVWWVYRYYCLVLDGYDLEAAADRIYDESHKTCYMRRYISRYHRISHTDRHTPTGWWYRQRRERVDIGGTGSH